MWGSLSSGCGQIWLNFQLLISYIERKNLHLQKNNYTCVACTCNNKLYVHTNTLLRSNPAARETEGAGPAL